MKTALFKDLTLEKEFEQEGFVVLPEFLNNHQIEAASTLYNQTHLQMIQAPMWHTLYSNDFDIKQKVRIALEKICLPAIQEVYRHNCIGSGYFMIKNHGADSASKPHQDPSFIDYNKYNSGTIWIPLTDINTTNGYMYIYNKSHHNFTSPIAYFQKQAIEEKYEEIKKACTPIFIKKGDALFFNHRVIHGSVPNLSGTARPVIAYSIFPNEAQLYFPYLKKRWLGDEIRYYEIDSNFFSMHDYHSEPVHLKLAKNEKIKG